MKMDVEQERTKLINVLRRTARMAQQAQWTGAADDEAAVFCVTQYNRVLARLSELDESLQAVQGHRTR